MSNAEVKRLTNENLQLRASLAKYKKAMGFAKQRILKLQAQIQDQDQDDMEVDNDDQNEDNDQDAVSDTKKQVQPKHSALIIAMKKIKKKSILKAQSTKSVSKTTVAASVKVKSLKKITSTSSSSSITSSFVPKPPQPRPIPSRTKRTTTSTSKKKSTRAQKRPRQTITASTSSSSSSSSSPPPPSSPPLSSSKNNTSKSTSSFTSSSTESAWYDPLHSSICDSTSSSHQIDVESLAQSLHTSKKHTPLTLASVLVGLLEQHASHHYDVWKLLLIRQTNRSNVQQFRRRKKSLEECIQSTNLHLFRLAVDMGSTMRLGPEVLENVSILLRSRIVATDINESWKQWKKESTKILAVKETDLNVDTSFTPDVKFRSPTSITSIWLSRDFAISSCCLDLFLMISQHMQDFGSLHVLCMDVIRAHNVASVLLLLPALEKHEGYFFSSKKEQEQEDKKEQEKEQEKVQEKEQEKEQDPEKDPKEKNENKKKKMKHKANNTSVIWPLKEVIQIILTDYLFETSSIIDRLQDTVETETIGLHMMNELGIRLQNVGQHLHSTCGWSASLSMSSTEEEQEESDNARNNVIDMLIRFIFWDRLPALKGAKKNEWHGRPRSSIQQDAWCAVELLASTLPNLVFESIINPFIWKYYIVQNGGGGGSGGSATKKKKEEIGHGSKGQIQHAAIALCGDIAKHALIYCIKLKSKNEELKNIHPFEYLDLDARNDCKAHARRMIRDLNNATSKGLLEDMCNDVVVSVVDMTEQMCLKC